MITRRKFLVTTAVFSVGGAYVIGGQAMAEKNFPIRKTDAQWKEILTPAQFRVLRGEDTEPPGSSPLNAEKRKGVFHCAGCDLPVYSSEHKYESGTGWPSFWRAISDEVIGTKRDWKLLYPRTEVHCARCGGHFGHIFNDGPEPTGKRHCLNGVALTFKPSSG